MPSPCLFSTIIQQTKDMTYHVSPISQWMKKFSQGAVESQMTHPTQFNGLLRKKTLFSLVICIMWLPQIESTENL
ncbi:hypothetical protein IRJ41_024614 [Triplophysa rosa]|uniref:Uncharacterized protein n=1 Tax=Triplophysa rosa TaxID=992332 RepID=A0A9W7TLN3_TRIRA|nr:hypothetical protein IRJ41_024614 [Triplophysa rosa]